ncbi:MAG: 3-keto-disaccharide hydrolase [Luteolibacter sp.]
MKNQMKWLACGMLFGGAVAQAEEGKDLIPGTPYKVHDMERPQPRIVESGGAVSIAPPSDATVLFDGTNLDAWTSGGKDPLWKIEDGVLVAVKNYLDTKEKFGAIQLHLEWKLPKGIEVNGQKGGNSGCFLMGLYEVQILQSNNNETYPDGQATALYGQLPPLVNATSPQGEWNSYDITFIPPVYEGETVVSPAKVTVIHNGVVVQNGESFIGPTGHKNLAKYPKKHPETGPIRLQFHGDPMEFRNIWVRPLGERDKAE